MLLKNLRIYCTLFFASLSVGLFAQNNDAYQIDYDFKFRPNKLDTTVIISEDMLLTIEDQLSDFQSHAKIIKDSALKQQAISRTSDFRGIIRPKLDYCILKNRNTNSIQYIHQLGVNRFYYIDSLNMFDWQLVPEKKEILGYTCNKATVRFAGRNYTAWYATAIPVAEGPYKFNGLPGLILELYDSQNHFHFTAQGIKKTLSKKVSADAAEGYVKTTKKEYFSFLEKIRENPALMFESEKLKLPKEMLDKINENGRSRFAQENNPLEIY